MGSACRGTRTGKRKMSRTKIIENSPRSVTLSFTDLVTDQPITMEIWAPAPGASGQSYIRYNGDKQLCNGLSSRGETLSYRDGTKLVDLVRQQYRSMRAAERRAATPRY